MSWRTVIISNQSKLDYKMGFMVVRGEATRRVSLEETVLIDGNHQLVSNAIKIYTHSVFEAINDGDPSEIKFFEVEEEL